MSEPIQIIQACPFCGKTPEDRANYQAAVGVVQYPGQSVARVTCQYCGTQGPIGGSVADAVEVWNARAKAS